MAQKQNLANINVITDDDTGMYSIGEISGGFKTLLLNEHIKKYGSEGLLKQLTTMIYTVVGLDRNIKNESAGSALCDVTRPSCTNNDKQI